MIVFSVACLLWACSDDGAGPNTGDVSGSKITGVDGTPITDPGKRDSGQPLTDANGAEGEGEGEGEGEADASSVDPLEGQILTYNTTCKISGEPSDPPLLTTTRILKNLNMMKPIQFVSPRDGSGRVFIVGQTGRIHMVQSLTENGGGTLWLDISSKVDDYPNEGGLLSIAFPDDFATTGNFFAYYTRTQWGKFQGVVSLFQVNDPAAGYPDSSSEQVLLTVDQPYSNHNGGGLEFGPDGMLYLSLGDGGSAGAPLNHGQTLGAL